MTAPQENQQPRPPATFWRLVPSVRSQERQRFLFFAGLAGLVGLAQTIGIAASEALLLSRLGIDVLPATFVAASLTTVAGSVVYATAVGRLRNDTLFVYMLAATSVVLVLLAIAAASGLDAALPMLLCVYYLTFAVFLNHFWTFAGDYFDTLASKRLFPLFTVGSSGGSIGGALLTTLGGLLLPAETLIGGWAAFLLAAAFLLRRYRRPLRRWGPLALAEADETSVDGIRGAVRVIRHTALGRTMLVSAVSMVLALLVMQYLYSDIFASSFGTAGELATFIGIYLTVTNLLEVAVELWLTPWLITRFGVASANMAHPLASLASFGFLMVDYRLWAAVVARMNRELLENALAGPVRNLVYNALPAGVRGQTRAFVEGIVVYSGMAIAGIGLLFAEDVDPLWLCLGGAGLAAAYLGASIATRRFYLATLVGELRSGRLDLEELGTIGNREISELGTFWQKLIRARDERAGAWASQVAPILADHDLWDPLEAGLAHPDPRVRIACGREFIRANPAMAADTARRALEDPESSVRLATLRQLPADLWRDRILRRTVERRLGDEAPAVRAGAAALLADAGIGVLEEMLDAPDPEVARAALKVLPASRVEEALARIDHSDPGVRAAALEGVARMVSPVPIDPPRLRGELDHASPRVRRAAVGALGTHRDAEARAGLVAALGDPARSVRRAAVETLTAQGDLATPAVQSLLSSDHELEAEAAVQVLAGIDTPAAILLLEAELRRRVRSLWSHALAVHRLSPRGPVGARFLHAAHASALVRDFRLTFHLLEHAEDPRVIRSVVKVLRFSAARTRGDALEVLSNVGDRETAQLLVLFAETAPMEDKLPALAEYLDIPASAEEVMAAASRSSDRWVRMAAGALEGDTSVEDHMEHLLALRNVPLFAHFTLEQLEAVSQVTREQRFLEGETVVRENDPGGELYLVLSGEVEVLREGNRSEPISIARLGAGDYFGEMAIFDNQPRSASVIVREPARLLVLAGERLKEIVLQTPEIAFQVFEVLTARIRSGQEQLEAALAARASDSAQDP